MMWNLQDIMPNILMWVTIYNAVPTNHGIDEQWNR